MVIVAFGTTLLGFDPQFLLFSKSLCLSFLIYTTEIVRMVFTRLLKGLSEIKIYKDLQIVSKHIVNAL